MSKKITLLDGAVGTSLWSIAEAHGVPKVPVWKYNIEHPEFVEELTEKYLEAGSEIILANTFGANGPSVKYSSGYSVEEVVTAGGKITKKALEGMRWAVSVHAPFKISRTCWSVVSDV